MINVLNTTSKYKQTANSHITNTKCIDYILIESFENTFTYTLGKVTALVHFHARKLYINIIKRCSI